MRRVAGPCALLCLASNALAETETSSASLDLDARVQEIVVIGQRATTAASAEVVRARDFLLRPRRRPADILEVTPGLEVVQHAGGGKANQYFLRGFDADHGTDLALSFDGVPVNMVSHGHGQGYADLHFIIPELVERLEISKGPYFAELGDFATAGAVNLVMRKKLEANTVSLGGGMFDTYRAFAGVSPELGSVRTLIAGEVYTTDGPFTSGEDLRRYNVFGRGATELLGGELSMTVTAYGAKWSASGQIPEREVIAGRLDRYGSLDPTEGGSSRRFNGYTQYKRVFDDGELTLLAYVSHYRLTLFSNFTFFSRDPVNGDMIEQNDDRILAGGRARYRRFDTLGAFELETTLGLETRTDLIDNGLYTAKERRRLDNVVETDIRETSLGAFANESITWTSWLRTELGVRGDFYDFDVTNSQASGSDQAFLVSPKASVIVTPFDELDLFANFGMGFHSNDVRGVVFSEVTPLARAIGGELGARARLFDRVDLGVAAYLLDLESEIVFVGDEGTTEAGGKTRRMGIEAEARVRLFSWLYADADVNLSRPRFVDAPVGEDEIPLAPRLTLSGGLSAFHPIGLFGRIGVLHIGDRPATEDGFIEARGFTKLDATAGYRNEVFEIALTVENLLDQDIREAQFATVSRLPNERSPASCPAGTRAAGGGGDFAGCEDLHFTPGPPISGQLTMSLFF